MKEKKTANAVRTNHYRCIAAIVLCSVISFLVFLAVSDQLLSKPDALVQEVGWKSYHMFTILSNMFMGVAAAMCIPYAADGLRYNNYHLPRWTVNVLFTGATGVALTFLIAVTVLSPMTSYYRMMLYSNNILFHTTIPILSIVLFIVVNSDHKVSMKATLIAITPLVLYALLYLVLVFIIGEENGGWRDHYQIKQITEHVPLPLVFVGMILIAYAVALVLRAAHNKVHQKRKAEVESYYQFDDMYAYPDIESAIKALAQVNRQRDKGGELIVPRRIMAMMENKYQSQLPVEEMCKLYIDAYYEGGSK